MANQIKQNKNSKQKNQILIVLVPRDRTQQQQQVSHIYIIDTMVIYTLEKKHQTNDRLNSNRNNTSGLPIY